MRRLPLLLALLALTLASASHAYTYGPYGCNLRWDHCYGDGGAPNKNFACDTNTGLEALVGSFVPAWDIGDLSGLEIVMTMASATNAYPAWWSATAGGCRTASAINASPTPVDPVTTNCPDWSSGNAVGGLAAYRIGLFFGPNTARILMAYAVPPELRPLLLGRHEYFAFRINISHVATVGTGACAGCTTPMCIMFTSVNMVTPFGSPSPTRWLTGPANQVDSDYATWQGGAGVASTLGIGCPAATPTRTSTWGSVKALYR